MSKPKIIYCPQCGRKIGTYDGRSTINRILKCKKCYKMVIYKVENGETDIKPLPKRACSSGMTFI